jgi:protein SCO1/2
MKIPRIVQFGLLAVLLFGLGVGFSLWRQKQAGEQIVQQEQVAEAVSTAENQITFQPAQPMPSAEPGEIIPNAPEMPVPAGTELKDDMVMTPENDIFPTEEEEKAKKAAEASTETPVAGVQPGGAFSLTDHKGKAVTEKSWPGKYKLVFFGYTSCPDICPVTLERVSTVMETLDPEGAKIQPLFITTDAAKDTREVMEIYVGGYNRHVVGLTGTKEQLDAAGKSYKVYAAPAPDGKIDHSSFLYLMSPDDKPLAVFSAKLSAEEMTEKVREKVQ